MNSFIFLWTLKFHFIFSWTRACIVILPLFLMEILAENGESCKQKFKFDVFTQFRTFSSASQTAIVGLKSEPALSIIFLLVNSSTYVLVPIIISKYEIGQRFIFCSSEPHLYPTVPSSRWSVTDTAEYQVPLSARSYSSVHIATNPGRPQVIITKNRETKKFKNLSDCIKRSCLQPFWVLHIPAFGKSLGPIRSPTNGLYCVW